MDDPDTMENPESMMTRRDTSKELKHCYEQGRVYEISRYNPRKPFADDEFYEHKDSHGMWQPDKIGDATHVDFVFNPKRYEEQPETAPVIDERTMLIRLDEHVNTMTGKNAQIMAATIINWSPETHPEFPTEKVIVKFFDPLFVMFRPGLSMQKIDVVYHVDHAISHETAALGYLNWLKSQPPTATDTLPEDFFPEFYGSWTTNFTSVQEGYDGKTSPVRLLLTEYIDGLNLSQMCNTNHWEELTPLGENGEELPAHDHPDGVFYHERRMAVVKKLLDCIRRLSHNGVVSIFPIRPWYIMIEGGWKLYENDGPVPRIVWVNFTKHVTGPFTQAGCVSDQTFPKPLHPGEFYSRRYLDPLNGWVPLSWSTKDPKKCGEWLMEAFRDGDGYLSLKDSRPLCVSYNKACEEIRRGKRTGPLTVEKHTRGVDKYVDIPTTLLS